MNEPARAEFKIVAIEIIAARGYHNKRVRFIVSFCMHRIHQHRCVSVAFSASQTALVVAASWLAGRLTRSFTRLYSTCECAQ